MLHTSLSITSSSALLLLLSFHNVFSFNIFPFSLFLCFFLYRSLSPLKNSYLFFTLLAVFFFTLYSSCTSFSWFVPKNYHFLLNGNKMYVYSHPFTDNFIFGPFENSLDNNFSRSHAVRQRARYVHLQLLWMSKFQRVATDFSALFCSVFSSYFCAWRFSCEKRKKEKESLRIKKRRRNTSSKIFNSSSVFVFSSK